MGWLDKGLKNIFKGGKEFLSSPAGIMALGVLAPYAAPWMSGAMAKFGATGLGKTALGKGASSLLGSPMISNALKNAAMNYGIATLTGSKHPGKAALWAGAASLPFTYMQGAQAASKYNTLGKDLIEAGDLSKATWADYALGKDIPSIPGQPLHGAGSPFSYKDTTELLNTRIQDPSKFTDYHDLWPPEAYKNIQSLPPGGPTLEPILSKGTPAPDIGGYFTRDPSALQAAGIEKGGVGSLPAMLGLENVDIMAALVPQVAGLYGGRMSPEERWLASQEKQIRMWAFQFGIPYEEAKEIWKDGWKNPYYTTQTPEEYGSFRNRGGYIDDYTAGGKAVGPGTGKSDSIQPVALSNGEFVFTEKATNRFPGGADGLYSLMNRLDPESETPTEARA